MNRSRSSSVLDGSSAMTFSVRNERGILGECLAIFSSHGISLKTIESRPNKTEKSLYDFFVEFDAESPVSPDKMQALMEELNAKVVRVSLLGPQEQAVTPWFPRKISDLDRYTQKCLQFGEELDADHPGFKDAEYRKRRADIVRNAQSYRYGQPIPRVEYTPQEIETWGIVYRKLRELYSTHACSQQNHILPLLEQNCGYGPDNIPQLEDISNFLQSCTGWRLRPVAGLLSPRDFLNGLAFRVFHSTQYIRHHSRPLYTPEPDVCHELLGHVPLFADPEFADFSQVIGLASLGASDEDIEKLATCYWFTVEFGLCKEGQSTKAFGAGLLSSFGELEYCLTDKPKLLPFEPTVTAVTPYPITEYQPTYFVAESFEDAKKKMVEFSSTLSRPFHVIYNPYTLSVEVVDSKEQILRMCKNMNLHISSLTEALKKMTF